MIKDYKSIIEESVSGSESARSKKLGLVTAIIFLSVLVFAAAGCTGGIGTGSPDDIAPATTSSGDDISDSSSADDVMVEPGDASSSAVSSEATTDKAAGTDAADALPAQNGKMVAMVVEDSGRSNPFLPFMDVKKDDDKPKFDINKSKLQYDLVDPPSAAYSDDDAQRVLTTKVSGIMYDTKSPSAILNIEDSDYLVRSGDVVNGYKILAISPSVVTVQLGSNVYKAGVGELLATDGIQYNTVSNLSSKFGGAKK